MDWEAIFKREQEILVDTIWNRANDSERFGFLFGLFPLWVDGDYHPSHDVIVGLIKRAEEVR